MLAAGFEQSLLHLNHRTTVELVSISRIAAEGIDSGLFRPSHFMCSVLSMLKTYTHIHALFASVYLQRQHDLVQRCDAIQCRSSPSCRLQHANQQRRLVPSQLFDTMETNELIEIALLLALIFLLYLANFLADIGTFDEIQVLRGLLQPILVAVSQPPQRAAQPSLSSVMLQIAQQVCGHGVEEGADSILGTDRHEIQRVRCVVSRSPRRNDRHLLRVRASINEELRRITGRRDRRRGASRFRGVTGRVGEATRQKER